MVAISPENWDSFDFAKSTVPTCTKVHKTYTWLFISLRYVTRIIGRDPVGDYTASAERVAGGFDVNHPPGLPVL
jgi:hypothetical protein